jgi:hypothetical protein
LLEIVYCGKDELQFTEADMQISVAVGNEDDANYNVHVYDLFGGGRNEVNGSPFHLAYKEVSQYFIVNAAADDSGSIEYVCEGGPELSGIEVVDQQIVGIH